MESNGKCMCCGKRKWITIVIALVLLVIAFYAGAKYEKNKLSGAGLLRSTNMAAPRSMAPRAPKAPGTSGTTGMQNAAGTQKTMTPTTTPSTATAPTAPSAPQTGTNSPTTSNTLQ